MLDLQKVKKLGQNVGRNVKGRAGQALDKASKTAAKAKGQQQEYVVALDIGTENVKALIGKFGDNGEIQIVGVGRAHQNLSDMQAGAIADIASVVENCDKALNAAEQQAGVSVRTAVIGIAGELVKGTTTTVRVARKNPSAPLDIFEMEKIIKLVQERAEVQAKKQLAVELGGKEVEVRLVNSALVSIDIDGYPVTNPIGFQGKDVIDLDLLAVAAEPFAVARSVIGNNPNQNLSTILMDVGGGTTDIAVVNEGGVQGTKMFGIGGRAYTRSVERDLGVDFEEAERLKLSIGTSSLTAAKAKNVDAALEKTLDVWLSGVELALGEFNKVDHLPYQIFLCGGGSSLDMLLDELQNSVWYKSLPFTRKPNVALINPDQVVGITDTTGKINDHTYITAMGLLRVGLDTLQFAGSSTSSIRDKLDKMLRV
jgi:cell division protein FtsA